MRPFYKKTALFFCAALTAAVLSGCGGPAEVTLPNEVITLPTAPVEETLAETTSPYELVEEFAAVMEAGEIYTLDYYTNLKKLDLTGSTCYPTILEYMASHPQVEVTYTVDFGSGSVSNHDTTATLNAQGLDYQGLLDNLQYLPNLTNLSLPDIRLTPEQINALAETYPALTFNYTVDLFGSSISSTTTELDLSYMESSQVDEACGKLGLLPQLTDVTLNGSLSLPEVAKLQDANPGATFHYSFSLFGKTLSTTDEEVVFIKHSVGNEGEEQIRQALDVLDSCKRFVLDNCGLDNEVLAKIREDYRGKTKVVWRVWFGVDGRYSYLTDAETIRTVYNVTNDTVGPLRYCEDAKYMDMGHNDYLTDLTFVAYMPNLEAFIGSGSAVKELTGFENCKKLVWLELANCLKLENIDALEGCESLKYLNLSNTKVSSYQVLDSLPLELFKCVHPKASQEERAMFEKIHEDCSISWGGNVYGRAWRYKDNGKKETSQNYTEYYENVIRVVFDLDRREALVEAGLK